MPIMRTPAHDNGDLDQQVLIVEESPSSRVEQGHRLTIDALCTHILDEVRQAPSIHRLFQIPDHIVGGHLLDLISLLRRLDLTVEQNGQEITVYEKHAA